MRKKEKLEALVASVSQTNELDAAVRKIMLQSGTRVGLLQLGDKLDVSLRELRESIARLNTQGYEFQVADTDIVKLPAPPGERETHIQRVLKGNWIKIGLISDNQLGNKTSRLDVLNTAYDHYEAEGIVDVYHAGNVIDGFLPRINAFELLPDAGPSIERQCAYAATVYPKKDGISTHFVTGDCFSGDTEVLTRDRGFVRFDELVTDVGLATPMEAATLNLVTGAFEWQTPIATWKRPLRDGETMRRFVTKKVDLLVTEGHNMLFRDRDTALTEAGPWETIQAKDWPTEGQRRYRQMVRACWGHVGEEPATLQGFDALDWVRFMGWYLAEGNTENGTSRIQLSQMPHSPHYEEIGDLLRRMGLSASSHETGWRFSHAVIAEHLRPLGRSWEKYIPEEIKALSPRLLREFLLAYYKGDGTVEDGTKSRAKGHLVQVYTASRRLVDDVMECLIKIGLGANVRREDRPPKEGDTPFPHGGITKTRRPGYVICASRNIYPHYRDVPEVITDYAGDVYCLSVPNGTLMIRRNGIACVSAQCH